MINLHVTVKASRAYSHEGQTVTVSLVHISLYFEHKCREIVIIRADLALRRHSGQGRCGHFDKVLKERFNAEIRQRRSEEYGRKLSSVNRIKVKFIACAVEKLNIIEKGLTVFFADKIIQAFI